MRKQIVTIDGPSGAGKSTVAKILADKLGYIYVDTGAMFRAVAYAYKIGNEKDLEKFLNRVNLRFEFSKETRVFLDGVELKDELRDPTISLLASELSKNPNIREYLKKIQREVGKDGGIVIEGRDTGSVIFPDADVKFFLDADIEERAKRRFLELKKKSREVDLKKIREEIEKRDREDSSRNIAPLVVPKGAIYVDTTSLSVDEVVNHLLKYIRKD